MPIINDKENEKTIDTETGIFFRLMREHTRERCKEFVIVDGEKKIGVSCDYEVFTCGEEGGGTSYTYVTLDVMGGFQDMDEYYYYAKMVPDFLKVYQFYYGPGSDKDGGKWPIIKTDQIEFNTYSSPELTEKVMRVHLKDKGWVDVK